MTAFELPDSGDMRAEDVESVNDTNNAIDGAVQQPAGEVWQTL